MYILFEEHQYESHLVENVLKDIYVLQDVNKKVTVKYVGYFYNPHLHDCVFILPKVLLRDDENKIEVLSGITDKDGKNIRPKDILTPEGQNLLSKEYCKFIYEFSVWIYRTLSVYHKTNPKSQAILYKYIPQISRGKKNQAKTYLDIVLSLIRFNQENSDYVLFTIKNLHRGNNKINWKRTISRSLAMVEKGTPTYLNLVNKKRVINYEEELFVIFFSILNYLNKEYGFRTPINLQYDLIQGKQFNTYLNGLGKVKLMQIKYKYFSDKALQLWDLCYAFFENTHYITTHTNAQEYMLAKNFEFIFEAMIDELIGTPHNKIPKGLADQQDGKRVDHIYIDMALTSPNTQTQRDVYYIGDSKYYKNGHALTLESIYKQYTYARNVVQWNINLFLGEKEAFDEQDKVIRKEDSNSEFGKIHLQDNMKTEGYDIIPNFFISAFVYDDHRYVTSENIRKHTKGDEHCTFISYQFPGRLFDRDTLFLSQYDVNFLYILYLYARNKENEKARWRSEVRKIFREEIRSVIEKEYKIYAMRAKLGVDGELYLQQHFYELNGRVFQPYGKGREVYYAYARPLEKIEDTAHQYEALKKAFHIAECKMGADPKVILKQQISEAQNSPIESNQWLTFHYLERNMNNGILLGYYKDEKHLKWIMGDNDQGSLIYNVRLSSRGEVARDGAHSANFYDSKNIKFVILYTNEAKEIGEYRVFHVKDTAKKVTEKRMKKTWYPSDPQGNYYFFRFDEEVTLGKIDLQLLLKFAKEKNNSIIDREPLFVIGSEAIKFRLSYK